ncbi:hypothetical protein [Halobellus rubicundus]|uniref:Uncharacterized protein n=1 Tax=Halobellus rubicundus TaxID=2996466 RepID=A0ABD5MDF2_9EURY
MSALQRRFAISGPWKRPLAISTAVTVLYASCVFGYSLLPGSNVSISGTLWGALALSTALGLVTIGVPVFLWLRYEIRSPGVLLAAILTFWHVLVYVPPIGSGQGDSPGFLFVFVWAPMYLGAYVLLAVVEYWLRNHDLPVSVPSS